MADGLRSVAASAMSSLPLTTFCLPEQRVIPDDRGGFPPCRENHWRLSPILGLFPEDRLVLYDDSGTGAGWCDDTDVLHAVPLPGSVLFCPTVCAAAKP